MDVSEWVTILKYPYTGDEDCRALNPMDDLCTSFDDIRKFLNDEEENHKGNYDELRIEYCWKTYGYGAETNWYELQGRHTDPTKIVLYGQIKKDPQP